VEQIRETLHSPILVTPAVSTHPGFRFAAGEAGMTSFIIRGGQIAMTVSGNSVRISVFLSHGFRVEYDGQWVAGRLSGTATQTKAEDGFQKPCGRVFRLPFESIVPSMNPASC
jgi:hypothetical protein